MAKKMKKLNDSEMKVKGIRKPGQVTGIGNPGTTTYTGKPGVSRGKK